MKSEEHGEQSYNLLLDNLELFWSRMVFKCLHYVYGVILSPYQVEICDLST